MPNLKEYFLQYIWKYQLFDKSDLKTTNNLDVLVIKSGFNNVNSGPDFLHAHVVIDSINWHGSVEVHLKSSDWIKHKHSSDSFYENVVLHVVWVHDTDVVEIPTIELKNRVDSKYISNFENLVKSTSQIPCANLFKNVPVIFKTQMLEKAFYGRIEKKSNYIKEILDLYNNDWEQTAYHILLRNFGFNVNSESFAELAQKLPVKILLKHKNNRFQIEALLFGVSGLLNKDLDDEYCIKLLDEYSFLKQKYSLTEILQKVKFLRLRPANFPTIRLAQFASFIVSHYHIFDTLNTLLSYKSLVNQFKSNQSTYWTNHYNFGERSNSKIANMGKSSIDLIIINSVVPVMVTYGKYTNNAEFSENAIELLTQIKSENNHKIDIWKELNFEPHNAYDSQSLIEMYDSFCSQKKCLDCSIGVQLLKK